jgi:Na+-transporting methylmalonyl-CoA/oxaloacetate decarboxylase gamma subunit
MSFRFYTNAVSQASRTFAAGALIVGLLLMGLGVTILALPEVFAFLAALVFFIGGIGCAITAVKIFLAQRKLDKMASDDLQGCRKNVHIHSEEHYYQ